MRFRFALGVALAVLLASCAGDTPVTMENYEKHPVRLPNGKVIQAEVMTRTQDMMRGMMFRDSLAPGNGMLFVHGQPGLYPYYMFQVRFPLDIIWMDANHRIVEIAADTPPCKAVQNEGCPTYGGHQQALFVLEIGGGMAKKNALAVGDVLDFY